MQHGYLSSAFVVGRMFSVEIRFGLDVHTEVPAQMRVRTKLPGIFKTLTDFANACRDGETLQLLSNPLNYTSRLTHLFITQGFRIMVQNLDPGAKPSTLVTARGTRKGCPNIDVCNSRSDIGIR